MYILGISAYFHDSAACLVKNGEILSAAQEERFTRKKHDFSFPSNAINYCLISNQIQLEDVDYIVFYEKPFQKFERLLETYMAFAPRGFKTFLYSMPLWVKDKLFQKNNISQELKQISNSKIDFEKKIIFSEHHLSHAASAFFPSPFQSSAVLTLDGVGEWATTSVAVGENNTINIEKEIHFPHSLGLLYSAFTQYLGFKVNSGEYKLMGLSPYGKPRYKSIIEDNLIEQFNDGSFKLNMNYFDYCTNLQMINNKFEDLFKIKTRNSKHEITQNHMDIAASIQSVIEDTIIKMAREIKKSTNEKNICMAGGVALNCVANSVIKKEKIFDKIWVQPAAGDAGGALGAALAVYYLMFKKNRIVKDSVIDQMKGSYLGPSYDSDDIKNKLIELGAVFEELDEESLFDYIAKAIMKGSAVGWMNGRMEFGPRALGNRSIIADPRSPTMQKTLNLKIKFRESFRPFAPSVLYEKQNEWFNFDVSSPYMLFVANINENKKKFKAKSIINKNLTSLQKLENINSDIPAVTHVDYSARLQTVHKDTNERFHKLISKFYELTGCPILINTSFNVRGEPIVCSPEDAFNCFMGTNLDILVIENFLLKKELQKEKIKNNYKDQFELD